MREITKGDSRFESSFQSASSFQSESSPERIRLLEKAVELEVDKSDFQFQSLAEEHIWDELEHEFHERCTKLGPVWIAA